MTSELDVNQSRGGILVLAFLNLSRPLPEKSIVSSVCCSRLQITAGAAAQRLQLSATAKTLQPRRYRRDATDYKLQPTTGENSQVGQRRDCGGEVRLC